MNGQNKAWDLQSFLQAVTAELDRAQDVLRVKSLNRPLTYTVKDVKLMLNVFAEYDGDDVRFRTAAPGEEGASKLEFDLGSITDRLVQETTKRLPTEGDEPLESLDEGRLRPQQRKTLQRLGVDTRQDLERLAKRRVKLSGVDFADLAARMDRVARRPRIQTATSHVGRDGRGISVFGEHLDEIRTETARLDGRAVSMSLRDGVARFAVPAGASTGNLEFETHDGETLRVRLQEASR